jgi:hypothetical protein
LRQPFSAAAKCVIVPGEMGNELRANR